MTNESEFQRVAAIIAKDVLNIDTLETRKSDSLDFHDLAVWQIQEALRRAYQLGQLHALDSGK